MVTRSRSVFSRFLIALLLISFVIVPQTGRAVQAEPVPQVLNAPGDHLVTNVSFDLDNPNILLTNQHLNMSFDYSTTEANGVYIWLRPYYGRRANPQLRRAWIAVVPDICDWFGDRLVYHYDRNGSGRRSQNPDVECCPDHVTF